MYEIISQVHVGAVFFFFTIKGCEGANAKWFREINKKKESKLTAKRLRCNSLLTCFGGAAVGLMVVRAACRCGT